MEAPFTVSADSPRCTPWSSSSALPEAAKRIAEEDPRSAHVRVADHRLGAHHGVTEPRRVNRIEPAEELFIRADLVAGKREPGRCPGREGAAVRRSQEGFREP